MNDRMSRCTCDTASGQYPGPDQDCPAHGDPLLFADEVDRLRAELEVWKGRYRSSVETYRDMADVISRVRAAAQKARDSNNAWDLEDLIRAALTGEGSA